MGDSFRVSKSRACQSSEGSPEADARRKRDERIALWVSVGVCFLSLFLTIYLTRN